jgi:hypothetical protein
MQLHAQQAGALAQENSSPRYLAQIELHTAAELTGILQRADQLVDLRQLDTSEPVELVLHGAEGRAFLRQSYGDNKDLVDLARKLSASNVVNIRVCERWMGSEGIDAAQLKPFVDTVTFGPAEVKRLLTLENYRYF